MKNKVISILVILALLFSFYSTAFADGIPNADGGGGGMGSGTSENSWSPGMDGVRVTIINAETGATMGTPIDYTEKSPANNLIYFGKKSKIHYANGAMLAPSVGGVYNYKNPVGNMPRIINDSGGANIEAVKRYFCSDAVAGMIANDFGIPYEPLISGKYKLFLEPIAYFKFNKNQVGMTATEAALYDQQLSGDLKSKMTRLTHQNLPLAMFLERPDLGFPAWSGATSGIQTNINIISSLGMGIVSYRDAPLPDPISTDVEYRVNTEVITAVTLNAQSEINPDSPATVTFKVDGRTYKMSNIVIPSGDSQLVWCKWTTPVAEQTITITISTNKGYLSANKVNAKIVDLGKNPPPDPKADDRNDNFRVPPLPNKPQTTFARWSVWWARWHPYFVWCSHGDWGHWVDVGWYDFFADNYTATLAATSTLTPDSKVPTANGLQMKSGYGVNNKVTATFSSSAPLSHITGAQTAISYFPEFQYNTYWRLLDLTARGYSAQLEFKKNKYSTYNQRSHFSPVWYPNGTYKVYTYLIDAWTPAGMLSMNLNRSVTIQGSVFDDWHIAPKK